MNWLLAPLQYDFIVRALLAAVIVGVVCSVLGVYIVLRGMAFLGDAMSHTILPGVVAAYFLGWPLAVGALVMGVLTALGIGLLTRRTALKEDTAIGVIFAGFFALGVAMLSAGASTICLLYTSRQSNHEEPHAKIAKKPWSFGVLGALGELCVRFFSDFVMAPDCSRRGLDREAPAIILLIQSINK